MAQSYVHCWWNLGLLAYKRRRHVLQEFVFTEEFYEGLFGLGENEKLDDAYWQQLIKVRSEVNRVLEIARNDKVIGVV